MATIIFDFDSTLIDCESLEEILKNRVDPERLKKIQEITNEGMSGTLDFSLSLEKRLEFAQIKLEDCQNFGHQAIHHLTQGMEQLIVNLRKSSIPVWIISGAIDEVLFPTANYLQIPLQQVAGVPLKWSVNGEYQGIDKTNLFSRSKWEGAKQFRSQWTSPIIAVGDSVTDFHLYEKGLVDYFIAFTQHVRRPALIQKQVIEASNVLILQQVMENLLNAPNYTK